MALPLDGVRVLDLTNVVAVAGLVSARLLAPPRIKIEVPGVGTSRADGR